MDKGQKGQALVWFHANYEKEEEERVYREWSLESLAVQSPYRPMHGSAKDVIAVQGNGTHSSALLCRAGEGTYGVLGNLVAESGAARSLFDPLSAIFWLGERSSGQKVWTAWRARVQQWQQARSVLGKEAATTPGCARCHLTRPGVVAASLPRTDLALAGTAALLPSMLSKLSGLSSFH